MAIDAFGTSAGVTGRSSHASAGCDTSCHGPSPGNVASAAITGPTALNAGESATYTLTATQAAITDGVKMGINVATSDALPSLSPIAGQGTALQGGEITHASVGMHVTAGGSAGYQFTYTMPPAAAVGSFHHIFGVVALSFSGWRHAAPVVVMTRPVAPTTLTPSGVTDSSVHLAWSGGGPEYMLVYKPGPVPPAGADDGTRIENLSWMTSTTVVGLAGSTQYSFRLFSKILHMNVFSSDGPTATITTLVTPVPRFVSAPTGVDSGTCETHPCRTITYAMTQAASGETIHVRAGTYSLASGEVFPIVLRSGVHLVGDDPAATIIDAAGDTVRDGIIKSTGNTSGPARISGLTLRNGSRSALACASPLGGALYVLDASAVVTVTRNVFENNQAIGYSGCAASGGAIAVVASTVRITNNIFRGNAARGGSGESGAQGGQGVGGAIYFAGPGSIANNTFYGNSALGGDGGNGGAAQGGALMVEGVGAPAIVNNLFAANVANSGSGGTPQASTAGAILVGAAATPFTNNLLHANLANGRDSTGDSQGAAPVHGDPFFYSAPSDLHIAFGSAAARSGTHSMQVAPTVDHDLLTRPNPPSIGAFEPSRFSDPLPPRLANISTRGPVQTRDHVLIGGFIIGGFSPKTVLVRARGPMMIQFGIADVLHNPQLRLYSGQTQIAFNDNWADAPNAAEIQASGYAPDWPSEAAILTTLAPGPYTAIVTGFGGTTGIGIVEVFELDQPEVPLVNISTRGPVLTQDHVLIGGFIIFGNGPQTVLLRARGPSMAQFNVPDLLGNPHLRLFSLGNEIASNDNWTDAPNAGAILASGLAPEHGVESAILTTLQPGAYTAVVTGAGNTTGIAIVEVFRLD